MNPPPGDIADSQSEAKRMIGDFDGSAHTLWGLYGREAKSHDKAQIQTLKEDMDGVLIFVRLYVVHATVLVMLIHLYTGWFIFCRPHLVHNRQQTKLGSRPRRPNGVLSPTKRCRSRSDFAPNLLHRSAGFHQFHFAVPCFQAIGIQHPHKRLLVHGPCL